MADPINNTVEIGKHVEFSIDTRVNGSGQIVCILGEYALIRDCDDIVKAIETWRIRDKTR